MRRLTVLVLASTVGVLAAPSGAAAATGYCSPTGDYCYGTKKAGGVVRLSLVTFSFRGTVAICVTTPKGARTCKPFRLSRMRSDIDAVDARWSAHFPNGGRGTYRVTFAAGPVGTPAFRPTVTFRR